MLVSLRTHQELHKAHYKDHIGKHAEALLHMNSAVVFAMQEMPERVPTLRVQIDRYRNYYFPRRDNA